MSADTVVRAMNDVNGKCHFSGSGSSETLGRISKKCCTVDLCLATSPHMQMSGSVSLKGACLRMREVVAVRRLFLPCDAVCTVSVIVILSVRQSVRLSVTLVDCVHMVRPTIMISSPQGSTIILVSGDITIIPKFEGGHPERGR